MEKELVLKTMREARKPIAAGEIVSPVRCKWTPAE